MQHVPTEFERINHLKDSTGADIEPVAQEGGGDHGHLKAIDEDDMKDTVTKTDMKDTVREMAKTMAMKYRGRNFRKDDAATPGLCKSRRRIR